MKGMFIPTRRYAFGGRYGSRRMTVPRNYIASRAYNRSLVRLARYKRRTVRRKAGLYKPRRLAF